MTKELLFLIILTLSISCDFGRQENLTDLNVFVTQNSQHGFESSDRITMQKDEKNIRFDFTAGQIEKNDETIEIKASLFNDNLDTVYFLSSTCDGEQYSLCYDTLKFVSTPIFLCNASFPKIIKIGPKGKHDFKTHFKCVNNETIIKLGFDFYSLDKSYDLKNKNLEYIRSDANHTVIWAIEKSIK